MNILVTTLGTSWPVVPELLAFTNPESVRLFREHPKADEFEKWRLKWDIQPADEVWIPVSTGERVLPGIHALEQWFARLPQAPVLRFFSMEGVEELATHEECRCMQELIFRTVLGAVDSTRKTAGKLYLSLAGGRKTVSADLQSAAEHFGCDLLLHIVDVGNLPGSLRNPEPEVLLSALPAEDAACLNPLVIRSSISPRTLFQVPEAGITAERFPLPFDEGCKQPGGKMKASTELADQVDALLKDASNLMLNFTTRLLHSSELSNFHALYSLSPDTIEALQHTPIGLYSEKESNDEAWLRQLPKAELHCHFGGILDAAAQLEIATAHAPDIYQLAQKNASFESWLSKLKDFRSETVDALAQGIPLKLWKESRDDWGKNHRHIATSALLLYALGTPERIDAFTFGSYLEPEKFRGIGIDAYERLGDLQGSSLLQTEQALRLACRYWVKNCRRENIIYCEIRCSPLNCTLGGLSPQDVVKLIRDSLQSDFTRFKLIFIGSRHGQLSEISRTIELAQVLQKEDPENFDTWFAGFDLAGAEHRRSPAQVRSIFEEALKDCHNITIHAGENEPAENIWEAVYELNADRIGHGLTLGERPDLLKRLRQRRVAIEMCPSSNDQIAGFRDHHFSSNHAYPEYPLCRYLEQGLRVTINTDDPGMSRTTLTREYLKAAHMSPGGFLSRWQVLQLVRNAFKAAFLSPNERKQLIGQAEKYILNHVTQN